MRLERDIGTFLIYLDLIIGHREDDECHLKEWKRTSYVGRRRSGFDFKSTLKILLRIFCEYFVHDYSIVCNDPMKEFNILCLIQKNSPNPMSTSWSLAQTSTNSFWIMCLSSIFLNLSDLHIYAFFFFASRPSVPFLPSCGHASGWSPFWHYYPLRT